MDEMISMRMKKSEVEKNTVGETQPANPDEPRYPYGLEIRLEKDSLEKLGIDLSDYEVGDTVMVHAFCEVKRKSESMNESIGNGKNEDATLEFQITDMCVNKFDEDEYEDKESLGWDDPEADRKLKEKGYR